MFNPKKIPGFDRYFCDEDGNIYSDGPTGNSRKGSGFRKLKPFVKSNGYLSIGLKINDVQNKFYIHRLILLTWKPEGEKETCNHINGNKTDNRVINLEWATRSENMVHSTRILGNANGKGEESNYHKLSNKDVINIRNLRASGLTFKKIADIYNMNESWIYRVAVGQARVDGEK